MTIEYIRYALKDHSPDVFLAAYAEAAASLAAAPECLGYEITRCEEDASAFILRIHWVSTQAHLDGFRKGPHFPPFLAAIRDFMPEIAEMRHYAETPLVWARPDWRGTDATDQNGQSTGAACHCRAWYRRAVACLTGTREYRA